MGKNYVAKGKMWFCMMKDEEGDYCYATTTESIDDLMEHKKKYEDNPEHLKAIRELYERTYTKEVDDLIEGNEFLEMVNEKGIMNDDGFINMIYVDGFESNLGLVHIERGFMDGNFLVDEKIFADICDRYTVEVDWANK